MTAEGWAERDEIDAIQAAVRKEVDEGVAFAEASPYPDPATLADGVYEGE